MNSGMRQFKVVDDEDGTRLRKNKCHCTKISPLSLIIAYVLLTLSNTSIYVLIVSILCIFGLFIFKESEL